MGILEQENKKQIRLAKLQKAILQTIYAAGVISVALIAPNVLTLLKGKNTKEIKNGSIQNSRLRLIKNGLVYYENGFLRLTPAGVKILERIRLKEFNIKKPKKWDKKWRVLIFDIKESKRVLRNQIRFTLNQIGFVKLQNSVWVYPYDCEDYINLLKADFKVGKEILYIIADRIENEKVLLKHYNL